MKRLLLPLMLTLSVLPAYAANFTREDLVGDWLCQAKDEGYQQPGLLRYHADGTAEEFSETIMQENSYASLALLASRYRWQLKGDELHMSQMSIDFYEFYEFTPNGLVKIDDATTAAIQSTVLASFQENNWHYLEFDDKDHHRYRFDDGFGGECRRLA